jgi:protein arginine kinase
MQLPPNNPWTGEGPEHEVVLSCRVRLARNLAGYPFVNRATRQQCEEILRESQAVLVDEGIAEGMMWVDLNKSSRLDRGLLVERHLISKNHAEAKVPRGVAISANEAFSAMVNEEDHLRMQMIAPGLQLDDVAVMMDRIDDRVESQLDYAFSAKWGYLTACPTNVGSGIRFSVMLHLPALKITREIERVRRAAKELNLAVRGYYGEGSESAGDFYQISNQITLGKGEADLLAGFQETVLPRIIEYEAKARRVLCEQHVTMLDDRTHRALGTLRGSRILATEEAMKLLSRVRLGVCLGRITDVALADVNRLFLQIQPAHLQMHAGGRLTPEQMKEVKANVVREALN